MLLVPPLMKVTTNPTVSPDETVPGEATTDEAFQPGFDAIVDPTIVAIDNRVARARAPRSRGILRFICLTLCSGVRPARRSTRAPSPGHRECTVREPEVL